jgi:hypothetical protein
MPPWPSWMTILPPASWTARVSGAEREHALALADRRHAGRGAALGEHDRVALDDEAEAGGDVGHEVLGVGGGGVAGAAGALEHGGAVEAVAELQAAEGDRVGEAGGHRAWAFGRNGRAGLRLRREDLCEGQFDQGLDVSAAALEGGGRQHVAAKQVGEERLVEERGDDRPEHGDDDLLEVAERGGAAAADEGAQDVDQRVEVLVGDAAQVRVVVEQGALDQAREVALLREVLEVGADAAMDALARGAGLREGGEAGGSSAPHRLVDDLAIQALLRAEVVADQRRVHARGAGDVSHRGGRVADLGEGVATGGSRAWAVRSPRSSRPSIRGSSVVIVVNGTPFSCTGV